MGNTLGEKASLVHIPHPLTTTDQLIRPPTYLDFEVPRYPQYEEETTTHTSFLTKKGS